MKTGDIMTTDPACCTRNTNLREVAQMMVENDCGCIPVVDGLETMKPVGTITDRDIACRAVAEGKNPLDLAAGDCMSEPCVTIGRDASIDECCDALQQNQVRRLLVTDGDGRCCGIVAQADIVENVPSDRTAQILRRVSEPTDSSSNVVG